MTDFKDSFIKAVTEVANTNLHTRHPDINVKEWQTEEILVALHMVLEEYKEEEK